VAVQKSRKSRSKRGMRRSHDAMGGATLSVDSTSGETHHRHHITADGYSKAAKLLILATYLKIKIVDHQPLLF